ncbi:spermatogenesis-associated protein 22 [Struthio camelus]|uniref:spermatogenesis-associated protein 22 n=1 Tax=Struthio camelus TaxID=8801 RepID=UPI003603B44A
MAPSLMEPQNASKSNSANAGKNLYAFRAEEKTTSTKVWNRNVCTSLSNRTDLISDSGIIRKFENISSSLKTVQQQKNPGNHNSSQHIKTAEISQTYSSKAQWPVKPNTVSRSLQDHSLSYKFNHNIQQNKMNEKQFNCVQEDKTQEISSFQLKLKEKQNSLRIISAVIESMKHWSQYAYKTVLLFEVLGTLDSAVTPGAYGAKNFLLRDGKESLPCVFYEIDRELPRLIRGRVHRCMGNYDTKRNIFKCVSVRPATIPEQNAFQEFVKIADVEMTAYVKTMNEI